MIRKILSNDKAFATPIVLYLVSELGSDAFTYEPETIGEYLRSKYSNTDQQLIDRTNAALGLYTSDLFWNDPVSFGIVCRALNRHKFPFAAAPDIADVAWGITEANLLMMDTESGQSSDIFSDSITKYVQYLLKINNIYSTPACLKAIGDIHMPIGIDDPEIADARQQESDLAAAKIDSMMTDKTIELMRQIKDSGVPLVNTAVNELDQILMDGSNDDSQNKLT